MKTLREDQAKAREDLREAVASGERRVVVQAPCGFGKTVLSSSIVASARAKGKRILFTVPAVSLVDQTVEAFWHEGIRDIGVIQANHNMTDWSKPIQIASVQTLQKRGIPEVDVVIIDECHKWFRFFERWFADEKWRKVPIIGLSATPWLKGLGSYFNKLLVANTIENMIKQKTLAPFKVFTPSHVDLKKVRVVAGEYAENDLFEVMGKPKLVADIAESWYQFGQDRPTIAFCVNRAHADMVAKQFNEAGIPAGYMDCETKLHERKEIRRQFLAGKIKVVCNVDVIGLGVDWPEVSCLIYARPTRSEMRFVQNIGRGLRIAEGKQDTIILDHSDTHLTLGRVTDIHHETLDDGKPKISAMRAIELPKECPKCHYLKAPRTAVCPNCQFKVEAHATPVKTEEGTLEEFKGPKASPSAAKFPNKAATYGQLVWYGLNKGYNKGWAGNKYKELYGVYPRSLQWEDKVYAPTPELASWIRAGQIRWAKSKRNPNGHWHANGNGEANGHHEKPRGALTEREQAHINRVRDQYVQGYCTSDDLDNFR
jgi:DNA repair protein RadD